MMSSTVSFTTAGPSKDQWNNYQALITQLYQSKRLKEVMKVLERDFGFKASEKMYKSRIRKWQVDKKNKRHEMQFALKVTEKRRREGRSTQITIRGQDIAEADVRKYFKRLKTSTTSDAAHAENAPTPPEMSYGTPVLQSISLVPPFSQQVAMDVENETAYHAIDAISNNLGTIYPAINTGDTYGLSMNGSDSAWPVYTFQPELRAIRSNSSILWAAQSNNNNLEALWRTPANGVASSSAHAYSPRRSSFLGNDVALHPAVPAPCIYESVLHNIHAYINFYYFKSDKWLPHKDKILGQPYFASTVGADGIVLEDPEFLSDSVHNALQLFDLGHHHQAVSKIDSGCAMINRLVKEQHPQLLSRLLVAVSHEKAAEYKELIQVVLLHFYDMADIVFGPQHPLAQLSSWLSKALALSLEVSGMGLRVLREIYIQHAGRDHPESLKLMTYEASVLSRASKTIESETILNDLLQRYESKLGPLSCESMNVLFGLASTRTQQGDHASAKYLLEEHYRRLIQLMGIYDINEDKVWNLRARALLCEARHEYAEMRVLINEAWNVGTASLPADDIEMILLAHDFPAAEWHTPQNGE